MKRQVRQAEDVGQLGRVTCYRADDESRNMGKEIQDRIKLPAARSDGENLCLLKS